MRKQPRITVDICIECDNKILMIERKYEPFGWALPGGHLEYGETLEQAACRELKEETGLTVELKDLTLLGVWSEPKRDPRGHVISIAFSVKSFSGELNAGSDAKNAQFLDPKDVLFAFEDHKEMIARHYIAAFKTEDCPISIPSKDLMECL